MLWFALQYAVFIWSACICQGKWWVLVGTFRIWPEFRLIIQTLRYQSFVRLLSINGAALDVAGGAFRNVIGYRKVDLRYIFNGLAILDRFRSFSDDIIIINH